MQLDLRALDLLEGWSLVLGGCRSWNLTRTASSYFVRYLLLAEWKWCGQLKLHSGFPRKTVWRQE